MTSPLPIPIPPHPRPQEIRSSNCLLFLGAGFSFPARLPGWTNLLVEAAKKAAGFVKQTKPYNLPGRRPHWGGGGCGRRCCCCFEEPMTTPPKRRL